MRGLQASDQARDVLAISPNVLTCTAGEGLAPNGCPFAKKLGVREAEGRFSEGGAPGGWPVSCGQGLEVVRIVSDEPHTSSANQLSPFQSTTYASQSLHLTASPAMIAEVITDTHKHTLTHTLGCVWNMSAPSSVSPAFGGLSCCNARGPVKCKEGVHII